MTNADFNYMKEALAADLAELLAKDSLLDKSREFRKKKFIDTKKRLPNH